MKVLLVLGAVGLALTAGAVFAAWVMQRRVVQDLAAAVRVSRAVAEGRLNVSVPQRGDDEIGELLRWKQRFLKKEREKAARNAPPSSPSCPGGPTRWPTSA